MPTAEDFVNLCLLEVGDDYAYGEENTPGTPADETDAWDCSELVEVKLLELGIHMPDGSQAQYQYCRDEGMEIPLEAGIEIPGALLFRVGSSGHVAVSKGDGTTIEAMGQAYGVGEFSATRGRTFTHAALVPDLEYPDLDLVEDEELEAPVYDEPEPEPDQQAPRRPQPRPRRRPAGQGRGSSRGERGGRSGGRTRVRVPKRKRSTSSARSRPERRSGSRSKRGDRGGNVRRVQMLLRRAGQKVGKADGIFGKVTDAAVKTFQKQAGLVVDGIVGGKTWKRLLK